MDWPADKILGVLDACSDAATFPMLDNGYVYLAATRLSAYRSSGDPNTHWVNWPDGGTL